MKNLFMKSILVALVLTLFPLTSVESQQTNSSELMLPGKTSINSREVEYQFKIGEKVRASLLEGCSLFVGVVDQIESQKKINVTVQERLLGGKSDAARIPLVYTAPRGDSRYYGFSPWEHVDIQLGNRLFVSQCRDDGGRESYKIAVSKDEYFPSIRKVIEFEMQLQQNPNVLLEIPQIIEEQDDQVFAGYASLLLRGGQLRNSENVAFVLGQLLGSRKLLPVGLAVARFALRQVLIREGDYALSRETRATVTNCLVAIASDNDRVVDQVFQLFVELAEKDKVDIRPFLNAENRGILTRNYRTFIKSTGSQKGQRSFEDQLH